MSLSGLSFLTALFLPSCFVVSLHVIVGSASGGCWCSVVLKSGSFYDRSTFDRF